MRSGTHRLAHTGHEGSKGLCGAEVVRESLLIHRMRVITWAIIPL